MPRDKNDNVVEDDVDIIDDDDEEYFTDVAAGRT